jgi:hypothetical protein
MPCTPPPPSFCMYFVPSKVKRRPSWRGEFDVVAHLGLARRRVHPQIVEAAVRFVDGEYRRLHPLELAERHRALDGRLVRIPVDKLVDVGDGHPPGEHAGDRARRVARCAAPPDAGMRLPMVRSPARPGAGVKNAGEIPAVHLFVEQHAHAVGQLRVEERLQQRVLRQILPGHLGERVVEAELPAGLRMEQPERRVPEQRRHRRRQRRHVRAHQKIGRHLADLIVERREVVQLEVVLQEARGHQSFHQPHQLVARLQPPVGLVAELQVRDSARVVGVTDGVHAPHALQGGGRRRRSRRVQRLMIQRRHLVEAVEPRHGEGEHPRAVGERRPGTRARSADPG